MYLYGYLFSAVRMSRVESADRGAIVEVRPTVIRHRPVAVALPIRMLRFAMPHPDGEDFRGVVHGLGARVCSDVGRLDIARIGRWGEFVGRWLEESANNGCLPPLEQDCDLEVLSWLAGTHYNLGKKFRLLAALEKRGVVEDKDIRRVSALYKSFVKSEFYTGYKKFRTINGPSDYIKARLGPVFWRISQRLFHIPEPHRFTTKGLPSKDMVHYLLSKLGSGACIESDFTSFEGSFSVHVLRAVEGQFYRWMCKNNPFAAKLLAKWLSSVQEGVKQIRHKTASIFIRGKRMSGDMCTSLGNTFTNYMAFMFVAYEKGAVYRMLVEGDDGAVVVVSGPGPEARDFEGLGFKCDMVHHPSLPEAGYCKTIFSGDDLLTNPLELLARFGWAGKQYLHANEHTRMVLLRLRAMSMLAVYSGPIFTAFGRAVLRLTRGHSNVRPVLSRMILSEYERDQMEEALSRQEDIIANANKPISGASRRLMERKWRLSIEGQLDFEAKCDALGSCVPLDVQWMADLVPSDWRDYEVRFSSLDEGPRQTQLTWPDPPIPPGVYKLTELMDLVQELL